MPSGKLDNPATKLEIQDLVHIRNGDGSWIYEENDIKFRVKLLWLQGTIEDISCDMEEIYLREANKTVIVSNCKNIPGGNGWMEIGQYVMIFGEIQAIQTLVLNVRAIKISHLSNDVMLKQMWPYEVKEAKLIYSDQEKKRT